MNESEGRFIPTPETSDSQQLKQLVELAGEEQALQVYETIKQLSEGEFRDSQMKDENGELRIMWHGSPRKFESFKTDAKGEFRWRNKGVHFSSSRELIEQYADKAYASIRSVLVGVARQNNLLSTEGYVEGENLVEAKRVYNQIIEDLILNGEESQYYKKGYSAGTGKRQPDLDAITYKQELFGTDWALEIFNGEMPNKDNAILDENDGIYIGTDIGEYEYAVVLDIQKPYSEETTNMDLGFEAGEETHKKEETDGTILFHKQAVEAMGGLKLEQSKGTYSAAVFDPKKIRILGVRDMSGNFTPASA